MIQKIYREISMYINMSYKELAKSDLNLGRHIFTKKKKREKFDGL